MKESNISAEARELRGAAEPLAITLVDKSLVGTHSASLRQGDVVPSLVGAEGCAGCFGPIDPAGTIDGREHLYAALGGLALAVELGDEGAVGAYVNAYEKKTVLCYSFNRQLRSSLRLQQAHTLCTFLGRITQSLAN